MEKNKLNPEKNNSKKFAFLPEMVLEYIKDIKIKDSKENIKEEIINTKETQSIVFEPLADPFDDSIIEIHSKKNNKIY